MMDKRKKLHYITPVVFEEKVDLCTILAGSPGGVNDGGTTGNEYSEGDQTYAKPGAMRVDPNWEQEEADED